jgi:hypothetical protein
MDLLVRVYDAETVAFRIGQDSVVGIRWSLAPMHLGGAQFDETRNRSAPHGERRQEQPTKIQSGAGDCPGAERLSRPEPLS